MEKRIIVPGEELEGNVSDYFYEEKGKKYSMVYGLLYKDVNISKIVPLKGRYIPIEGDFIVGVITEVKFGGYVVDINSPYSAFLSSRREYDYGDVVLAKVANVNEVKSASLEMDKKLFGGDVLEISPMKVPRVIGKKESMLNLLMEKTGCDIIVGRNGRIWLKGKDPAKAEEAILKIEKEAHTDGLTNRMIEFLGK